MPLYGQECPHCLADWFVSENAPSTKCPICGKTLDETSVKDKLTTQSVVDTMRNFGLPSVANDLEEKLKRKRDADIPVHVDVECTLEVDDDVVL